MITVKTEIEKKCKLGEGAIWNHLSNRLLYIDIDAQVLFEYDPETGHEQMHSMPSEIGTLVPISEKKLIVALKSGICSYDLKTKELVQKVKNPEPFRFNDGKCDSAGRLWVGTLESETFSKKICNLYMLDNSFSLSKKIDKLIVSNGIAWSLDNYTMYHTDTPTGRIMSYKYDPKNGTISNPKRAVVIPKKLGMPDGFTLDSEGMLWVALWQGGAIVRCNPIHGEILQKIEVPAYNVTSVAFGGKELSTLFITTSTNDMTDELCEKYPLAGSLFSCEVGVEGIQANFFAEMADYEVSSK